jgi:hypothetical protein
MFKVRWSRRALNELTDAWVRADPAQRQAITAASHAIDHRLRQNAVGEGESRPKGRRIMFVPPLAVTFRIERDGHTASVLEVRMFRQRRP